MLTTTTGGGFFKNSFFVCQASWPIGLEIKRNGQGPDSRLGTLVCAYARFNVVRVQCVKFLAHILCTFLSLECVFGPKMPVWTKPDRFGQFGPKMPVFGLYTVQLVWFWIWFIVSLVKRVWLPKYINESFFYNRSKKKRSQLALPNNNTLRGNKLDNEIKITTMLISIVISFLVCHSPVFKMIREVS